MNEISDFLEPGEEGLVITTGSKDCKTGRAFIWYEERPRRIAKDFHINSPISHNGDLWALVSFPSNHDLSGEGTHVKNLVTGQVACKDRFFEGIFSYKGKLFGYSSSNSGSSISLLEGGNCNLTTHFSDEILSVLPSDDQLLLLMQDKRDRRLYGSKYLLRLHNIDIIHDEAIDICGNDQDPRISSLAGLVRGLIKIDDRILAGSVARMIEPVRHSDGKAPHVITHNSEIASPYSEIADFVERNFSGIHRYHEWAAQRESSFLNYEDRIRGSYNDLAMALKLKPCFSQADELVSECSWLARCLESRFSINNPVNYHGKVVFSSDSNKLYLLGNSKPVHSFQHPITGITVLTGELLDNIKGKTNMAMGSRRKARVFGMNRRVRAVA
jgi:hypothetical protein